MDDATNPETERQTLTPNDEQEYVECPSECPYCHSDNIESDPLDVDGKTAWARVTCQSCRRYWEDVFELKYIDTTVEDEETNG